MERAANPQELLQQQIDAMKNLFSANPSDAMTSIMFFRDQAMDFAGPATAEIVTKNLFSMVIDFHIAKPVSEMSGDLSSLASTVKQRYGSDDVQTWTEKDLKGAVDKAEKLGLFSKAKEPSR